MCGNVLDLRGRELHVSREPAIGNDGGRGSGLAPGVVRAVMRIRLIVVGLAPWAGLLLVLVVAILSLLRILRCGGGSHLVRLVLRVAPV